MTELPFMNYFEVFELPTLLNIDTKSLEKKFHSLSRQYHPDFYTAAPPDERSRALRMTALLNDAYRTLRHPTKRVEYLLSLYGLKPDGSKVPQSLLMEVFEINEQLEDIRVSGNDDPGSLEKVRRHVRAKKEKFEGELATAASEWDALISRRKPESELKQHLSKLVE